MEVFTLASDIREILIDKMTENLPVLRKKLKLSQENLAKFIGSSRYTVMLIETKKRRMTWNTFLSLVLLFDKNEETAVLLKALGIYTEDLDKMIKQQTDANC
jgi:DNA-binding XRE family transcriptional regulator